MNPASLKPTFWPDRMCRGGCSLSRAEMHKAWEAWIEFEAPTHALLVSVLDEICEEVDDEIWDPWEEVAHAMLLLARKANVIQRVGAAWRPRLDVGA